MALDALPNFKCMPGVGPHLRGAISISPSVEYMERAYDDAKLRGNFSRQRLYRHGHPVPHESLSRAAGQARALSCFVQYAPYKLRPGLNWDDQKEAFGDTVVKTIAEYAPNIKDIILHRQVITSLDLERESRFSEGNIFQGELSLEQLFFLRPAPGYARFRTPIQNLYMCGSATHPGGGIMGAPGRLAAFKMLKGVERRRLTCPFTSRSPACHPERGLFFAPQARKTTTVEGPAALAALHSYAPRRFRRTLKALPL